MCENDYRIGKKTTKWTFSCVKHPFRSKLFRIKPRSLESLATTSWEISPSEETTTSKAFFLQDQLERVTGWAFSEEDPRYKMHGGKVSHAATRGYLVKDVYLIDGALYKDDAYSWLTPRSSFLPTFRIDLEIDRAALYATASGNKYFGQWLMDDCVTYPLALNEGIPITTAQPVYIHTRGYEEWLDMNPLRLQNAFIRELVLFDDIGQNSHKHRRFREMGAKLTAHVDTSLHPGVFILRGSTGERRILENEQDLAEKLHRRRGFRILDPAKSDLPTIVSICTGAQTVVGVEGSGLMHGILALQRGGSLLTLQPPNRFVGLYKDMTDRDHQNFGFVVGAPDGSGFTIGYDEIERTLDLFPAKR